MHKLFAARSIKMKLIFSFSVIIALVLLLGITNIIGIYNSNKDTEEIINRDMQLLVAQEKMAINTAERTGFLRGYLLYDDEKYKQAFQDTVEETTELEKFILKHNKSQKVKDLMDKKVEWGHLTNKFFKEYEKGNEAEARRIMEKEMQPIGIELMDGFKELAQLREDSITEKGKSVIDIGNTILTIAAILMAIVVVLGIVVAYMTAIAIAKPLHRVKERMNQIANGDLSGEPLRVKGKDEIAQLMTATNMMNEQLKELLNRIKDVAGTVDDQSRVLTQAANEVQQGTEQVAATMEELASGAENQANHAGSLSEMMNDLNKTIEEVDHSSDSIKTFSNDVLQQTQSGFDTMESTNEQMKKIDQIVKDSVQGVQSLDAKTQEISKLVTVIGEIAEQTNLLALNAAIEAARAGEHGKGFAVVADEVRKLAEQVSESLSEITNVVNTIQKESDQVTVALQEGYGEVSAGSEQMTKTKDTFKTIYDAVNAMTDNISTVKGHVDQVTENSKEMNGSVGEIAAISEESAAGIEQTSAVTQQTSSSMEQVTANAEQLSGLANELTTLIKRFSL